MQPHAQRIVAQVGRRSPLDLPEQIQAIQVARALATCFLHQDLGHIINGAKGIDQVPGERPIDLAADAAIIPVVGIFYHQSPGAIDPAEPPRGDPGVALEAVAVGSFYYKRAAACKLGLGKHPPVSLEPALFSGSPRGARRGIGE